MGERTGIAWTDHTFNPWRGCSKISAGCTNCYAETLSHRNPAVLGEWGPTGARAIAAESYWRDPLKWERTACLAGVRRRVFCLSLGDVFEDRPDLIAPRARLFRTIDATPSLDWLLLTKRPENVLRLVGTQDANGISSLGRDWSAGYRVPNIWLGVSVEDQATADERIPILLRTPAAVRFISYEPAIGPVDFSPFLQIRCSHCGALGPGYVCERDGKLTPAVDWVIVGGESGPNARPFDEAWARATVAQCKAAVVPRCFVKQLGSRAMSANTAPDTDVWPDGTCFGTAPGHMGTEWQGRHAKLGDPKGSDPSEWPEDLRVQEFPRAA